MEKANICYLLFCSMLSYELPKSKPDMLITMPGRKQRPEGLKTVALQKWFC